MSLGVRGEGRGIGGFPPWTNDRRIAMLVLAVGKTTTYLHQPSTKGAPTMTTTSKFNFRSSAQDHDPPGDPLGPAGRRRVPRSGGDRHRAALPRSRVAINFFSYFFCDKIALKMSGAQPIPRNGERGCYQMVRELCHARRHPDAAPLRDPAGAAERLRDRPQPQALGRRRDRGHHEAALRGRAARRGRPRAGPHPAPRHPDPVGRRRDRRRDHLDRLHAALVRRRRRLAARPGRLRWRWCCSPRSRRR